MKAITKLIDKANIEISQDLKLDFDAIIINQVKGYGKDKKALKSFLEDMQKGGCQSGMIGEFIYHASCKDFYIKHIEDLEELKMEHEDSIGEIKNRQGLPHYTFVVWLCFEEYCYAIYNAIFEG